MLNNPIMYKDEAPSAKQAECFITIGSNRYSILSAKNFEANVNLQTAEVKSIGRLTTAHKVIGMEGKFSMTIYKCTPLFTDMVQKFKKTGVFPTFDIQVTSEDEATSIGRDTKIYKGCILDGDVLLSMFDGDGEFIEQEVSGFFDDWESPEDYTNPQGM